MPQRTIARTLKVQCALDSYEPTRNFANMRADVYDADPNVPNDSETIVLYVAGTPIGTRSMFILDDGETVVPYYIAGWRMESQGELEHPYLILKRFPTNHTRPDGREANFQSWMLGPRHCYHLKVKGVTE